MWLKSLGGREEERVGSGCHLTAALLPGLSFPGGSDGQESACNSGGSVSIPGSGRSPGEGNGNPLFLPGTFHGQRSLEGYSPWGHKESDMAEQLTVSISI